MTRSTALACPFATGGACKEFPVSTTPLLQTYSLKLLPHPAPFPELLDE